MKVVRNVRRQEDVGEGWSCVVTSEVALNLNLFGLVPMFLLFIT
jgi:hypothetical protein